MIKKLLLKPTPNKLQGKLTTNGVILEKHEMQTINFLLSLTLDLELICPQLTPGSKSPDVFMLGMPWEIKSPLSSKSNRIAVIFHRALKQSPNLIFDLRRLHQNPEPTARLLEKLFSTSRQAKNLIIIASNPSQTVLYKKH